jgi:hypothetical protein
VWTPQPQCVNPEGANTADLSEDHRRSPLTHVLDVVAVPSETGRTSPASTRLALARPDLQARVFIRFRAKSNSGCSPAQFVPSTARTGGHSRPFAVSLQKLRNRSAPIAQPPPPRRSRDDGVEITESGNTAAPLRV